MTLRIYFAPMEGITGYRYRNLHHRYFPGVDKYFMPFLSPSQGHTFTRREREDILPEHNQGMSVVPQLLARRSEDFLWAAGELAAVGYGEVNLNLGCPSGTVTAKGKGAGFLGRPEELERFLDEIFAGTPVPVSVKTRLGVNDPEEFGPLLELFNRYPIAELTIHPRVRRDFYRGAVRLNYFADAVAQSRNPVCYNGDLISAEGCAALTQRFPTVVCLMLGRGLVADPALAGKAKGGTGAAPERLEAFLTELYEDYACSFGSRRNAMLRMKEIWYFLIHLFRDGERYGKKLKKTADPGEYEALVRGVFRELELLDAPEGAW